MEAEGHAPEPLTPPTQKQGLLGKILTWTGLRITPQSTLSVERAQPTGSAERAQENTPSRDHRHTDENTGNGEGGE